MTDTNAQAENVAEALNKEPADLTGEPSQAPIVDPAVSAWITSAESRLKAFFDSAEARITEVLSGVTPLVENALESVGPRVESDLADLRTQIAPLLSRGKDLIAQMESLAKTDVSSFTKRLVALEGAVYSVAGPILGSVEHDAHGLLSEFFHSVKAIFKPKPPAPAATQSTATSPSATESSGPAASPAAK